MNTRRCLKIATRMDALLQRELGQGVDVTRLLADPTYTRDVLLVCESMQGSELADLVPKLRAALAAQAEPEAAPASGLRASRFLNSLFAASTGSPASTLDPPPPAGARRWFGRSGAGGPRRK